ncbi:MAG: ABC transporter permease [Lachnospiraceae bacterium]|nr:ABC transporter permease [Lachnospiraceae bacterium]MBR5994130.1 ABC transporter permease [Lachnospiraceae bacterium]
MTLSEILRLVWLNLSQNKFKVVLTSIGIIVGSATIMLVIAIGTGGKEEVAKQFKNLNAGAIDISYEGGSTSGFSMGGGQKSGTSDPGSGGSAPLGMPSMDFGGGSFPNGNMGSAPSFGGGFGGFDGGFGGPEFGGFFGGGNRFGDGGDDRMNREKVTLTEDDAEDLMVFVPGLSAATISYSTTTSIDGGNLDSSAYYTVGGVLDNYAKMSNIEIEVGSFISESNNESKEKVCVIGADVATEVFGSAEAAEGEEIYIDERPYKVIGVLKSMGSVTSGISPDTAVFVPYATGIKYITGTDISPTVTVVAEDVNKIDSVIANIESVLADSYPNTSFDISDAGSKMDAANASNKTLQLLLISMAAIVFFVGGIGIMNVLFVSVKERTNEIGILKALGCSREDILMEFLLEAAATSLVGSIIGILLALGITPIIEMFSISVSLSISGVLIALVFGVITGSVFGFYPAYKASRLVPVVALNAE